MDSLDGLSLLYWHWFALGVGLAVFEMLVPGVAMLWIGVSALVTGLVVWFVPDITWQYQFLVFGILGLLAVAISRRYLKLKKVHSADPLLNSRYERLVGHVITLETPIMNGQGRVPVDDGSFLVTGPDLPAGKKVRVVAVSGAVLEVEEVKV